MTRDDDASDPLSELAALWVAAPDGPAGPSPAEQRARRARRRRGWIVAAVILVVIFGGSGGYVAWALNAPLGSPTVSERAPAVPTSAAASITLPGDGASAVTFTGADGYFAAAHTSTTATSGSTAPQPIASVSKVITALVVLDAHPLDSATDPGPTLTFGPSDIALYDKYYVMGATIAPMPRGTRMSLHDTIATMLIPSACNYAEALALWAFGSDGAFADATARWLAKNGLTHTTIVEPTGLDHANVSTPADLLKIGKLAAANPAIAAIGATRSLTVTGPGTMTNTNDLLAGGVVTGLKTGNLGEGAFSLLYTATLDVGLKKPLDVTGAILGGASRESVDQDVLNLLDSIRKGFHPVQVATAGQEIGTYTTPWGSTAKMVVRDSPQLMTWSDTPVSVKLQTKPAKGYQDGEVVGTLTWTAGPETVSSDVEISGSITPPTDWWRITHPTQLG